MYRLIRLLLSWAIVLIAILAPGLVATSQTPTMFECPVTLPNNVDAEGANKHYAADGHTWFENGIWITIPADGVLTIGPMQQMPDDHQDYPGWGFEKLHVLRSEDVHGFIDITGLRLDQPSKEIPDNDKAVDANYGSTGFVPIALMIPAPGCWELTATTGDASATWVVEVKFEAVATPVS